MIRIIFSFLMVCIFAAGGVFLYFYSQIKLDSDSIIDYNPKLTTRILDRNGNLIANVFDGENRLYVKFDDIPGKVIEALVAVEDTGFFEHQGVNIEAIFRALIKDIKARKFVEGGSTITQQLIKNTSLSSLKKIDRKIKEAILAIKIEHELTKEQILERYFNEVYFGHGYYGIKTAALGYFKKDLKDLDLKEIAMLVGMPKAPSSYDPTKHLNLSLSRANTVLARMYELGWITKAQYEKSINEVPKVYNENLTQNKAPYVVDEVIKEASKILPNVKTGGYVIETSVDLKVQDMAREALVYGYNQILKRDKKADPNELNGAIVVTNPLNGDILALVGGVDYEKSKFNRATQSSRQPGSSFKPFIYQIALDEGYSPMSKIDDSPRSFDDGKNGQWTPKNYGKKYEGMITIQRAIVKSRNLATINMLYTLGLQKARKILIDEGFTNMPPALSIALGSFGISPLHYSSMYSMFPGMGMITKSKFITSVTDSNGNVRNFTPSKYRAAPPEQAYLMVDILEDVVSEGTGRRAAVPQIAVGGKTGTSNDSIDAWFCGFSPEINVIIWYGNDNYKPMRSTETGGRTCAPVFARFMGNYLKEFPGTKRSFKRPIGVFEGIYDGKKALYTDISPFPTSYDDNASSDESYSSEDYFRKIENSSNLLDDFKPKKR